MSIETLSEAAIPTPRDESQIAAESDGKPKKPSEYERLVLKYLVAPDVCQPCTDERAAFFMRAPMVWASRFPGPAGTIAKLEEIVPCDHLTNNSDFEARIAARIAIPPMVTVELP